ncbi:type II CRISPR-associated endonuclease Cas1 [Leuconostoc rapi]|uniref:type II CRISPR-associated endonuclease Cas1 n=1 Tax=Leuconostoc rapi TaxID=1406906 RepID=UPI0019576533|nr:type II CRISPR-associated endonuclease Cas1 [Leuconostoc rapi]MBM7434780.1 CRISPR-associated protein Cas1 [Leuconostoc rapi]
MAWRTVVITKHSKLNYKMNHLVVQTSEKTYQIPMEDIQIILITTTQAVVTAYVIAETIKRNIKIIFSDINGQPIGEINQYHTNGKHNRNIGEQMIWQSERKNLLWREIVRLKINNQMQILVTQQTTDRGKFQDLVDSIEIGDETNREAVAARMYFNRLFGNEFVRHESGIVNAMLDYGYQILMAAVAREVVLQGYLSELGIHHNGAQNDYNLASDLMEPFRPLIDAVAKKYEHETALNLDIKLALVEVINQVVELNGQQILVTNAISVLVRDAISYLNNGLKLPEWRFEI